MAKGPLDRFLTAVLTHPVALAVKRPVRDAFWRLRGLPITRRPLPAGPRVLLFICKGNICRSPFAERYAARLLAEAGLAGVRCVSAGFAVSNEGTSPAGARAAAPAFGVSLDSHRAAPLTQALVDGADVIVATEVSHAALLRARYPAAADRIALLPLFGLERPQRRGYARYNIADPYGKPPEVFHACYAQIAHGVAELVGLLRSTRPER